MELVCSAVFTKRQVHAIRALAWTCVAAVCRSAQVFRDAVREVVASVSRGTGERQSGVY